jgi:HSP20 family protein
MLRGTALAPLKVLRGFSTDPFREFQRRLNRFFGEEIGFLPEGEENISLSTWAPICDIFENENEVVVKAELPGLNKENVKVGVENNVLTIYGERKFEEETKRENYHRLERSYGDFIRRFTLPNYVDVGKIRAEFKEGVLNVTLPKRAEVKPKQVEVKVQ